MPGGNENAYTYPNNPINMVDLDGRSLWSKAKNFYRKHETAINVGLTVASFVPVLGVAAWAYRGYRVARVLRAVNSGRDITASRYITRVAAKRWVGRGYSQGTTSWGGRMWQSAGKHRTYRFPSYKNNARYRGWYSNFSTSKTNVHVKHRSRW